jgi:hypothetical protein
MNIKSKIFFIAAICTILISCSSNITYTTTQVAPGISINLASCLSKAEAKDVQYACYYEDTLRDFIFMIVTESKDTMRAYGMKYDINTYYRKTAKALCDALDGGNEARVYPDTINTYTARVSIIKGGAKENKLVYKLTVIETKNNFHQVIFAMTQNGENYYRPVCDTMLQSFKEN